MSSIDARARRIDLGALAVLAIAVRIPAYLSAAHLSFDDAVYGASAIAMRHGGLPFREVFSSQGPLHLPIIFAGDLLGGRTASSPRLAATLAGAVAAAAVYCASRRLTSRAGAVAAGLVVALSGCMLWVTGPVTADGPAIALATVAVAAALAYRDTPSMARAVATGVALGSAMSIKAPLVLLATIPVAGFVLQPRRVRDVAASAGAAVAIGLASSLPWGLSRVWDQSVAYQLESDRNASMLGNANKILSTLWERDPFLLAVIAVAVGSIIAAHLATRRGSSTREHGALDTMGASPSGAGLVAAWVAALTLFLVIEPAMWRNHIAHLVGPVAMLVMLRPPSIRLVAAAGAVALPFQVAHLTGVLHPAPYRGDQAAAVAALRALPDAAWAISDDPGFVWRAGRVTPFDLVDTSVKRVQQGRITTATLAEAADDRRVCAVLVWSAKRFGALAGLSESLAREGYAEKLRFDDVRVLYERESCTSSS